MQSDKCAAWWISTALFEVDLDPLVIAPRFCHCWWCCFRERVSERTSEREKNQQHENWCFPDCVFFSLYLPTPGGFFFFFIKRFFLRFLLPVKWLHRRTINEESRHTVTKWKYKLQPEKKKKCVEWITFWGFWERKTTRYALTLIAPSLSRFARVQTNNHFVNNWVKRCSLQSIYYNEYFICSATNRSHNHIILCRFQCAWIANILCVHIFIHSRLHKISARWCLAFCSLFAFSAVNTLYPINHDIACAHMQCADLYFFPKNLTISQKICTRWINEIFQQKPIVMNGRVWMRHKHDSSIYMYVWMCIYIIEQSSIHWNRLKLKFR